MIDHHREKLRSRPRFNLLLACVNVKLLAIAIAEVNQRIDGGCSGVQSLPGIPR